MGVNDKIQDRVIRHMVYLEKLKASEVRRISRILNEKILPDLESKIEKRVTKVIDHGFDPGRTTTKRLKDLNVAIGKIVDKSIKEFEKEVLIDLTDLTRDEINWQLGAIREELDFDIEMTVPAAQTVVAVTRVTPFAGFTLEQWFETLSRATQRSLTEAVQRAVVEGETIQQLMQRIRGTRAAGYTDGVLQTTRRQAEAIARSSVQHISNQARLQLFQENDDIVKGVKWTATLDSRTSLTCASLDGKVFPLDKGPRPPIHVNCRSTMTPVLKSARSLRLKDIPEGTRASIDGQVPESTTYGEWLRRQPVIVQEQVLGKTKAKLFRDGKLSIDKFTNRNLEPLNLEELRKAEKSAFKRAGVEV